VYLSMLAGWNPEPTAAFATNLRIGKLSELVLTRPAIARVWAEHDETP